MFIIGQSVITPYGAGVVTKVRENDVVVQPHAYWRLAEDTIPTFFMNPKDVTPAPPTAEEKVAKAKEMKTEAMTLFKAGNHTAARVAYTQAQEAIAQMPAGISDQCNAERFEITVTCANNIALCSFFLKDAQECFSSAQNSFRLVEALEGQISKGTSKVFEAICTIGTVKSVDDLRKTWKRKSVYFMGQAHVLKKDHKSAIQFFQEALALLGDDANFAKDATTISTKISQAKKAFSEAKKKEKSAYKKAFAKMQDTAADSDATPPPSPVKAVAPPTATPEAAVKSQPTPVRLSAPEPAATAEEKTEVTEKAEEWDYDEEEDGSEGDDDVDDEENWDSSDWLALGVGAAALFAGAALIMMRRK